MSQAFWRRAPVTSALVLACLGVYWAALLQGSLEPGLPSLDLETARRFGALAPERVWAGEPWRVLSAGLLHEDPLHLSLDLLGLVLFGGEVERRLGGLRTLLLLLGAQVGCASAALCFGDLTPRMGSSGMAYGLLGALLVSAWRRRQQEPGAFRWLRVGAPVALGLGLLGPEVDALGHLGGLAGGAALMVGLEPGGALGERAVSLTFALVLLGLALGLGLHRESSAIWQAARGYQAYEQDRCAEAIPHFQRALGRDLGAFLPQEVHAALGHCLLKAGQRDAGLAELEEAAQGGSVYGAALLGDQESDPHRGLRDYARALALRPADTRLRETVLRAVLFLCEGGDLPEARDLEPLRYELDLPGLEPVRLTLATAEAAEGKLAALQALAGQDTHAGRIVEALGSDAGTTEEAARQLRKAILAVAPEAAKVRE